VKRWEDFALLPAEKPFVSRSEPAFFAGMAQFLPSSPHYIVGTFPDIHFTREDYALMKTILVVDDSEDVRNLIASILATYGFTVWQAADGATAVQMMSNDKPDMILCDVNMPGMGGYETLAAVRESSSTVTIPFILMTGLVSHDGFRRGMASGADDYLIKPFTPDELIESVMSRFVRQSELQCDAVKRVHILHEYAASHSFPELAGAS
jgi:CheY-like chemotaxis protein